MAITERKVPVAVLEKGMYVSKLDRPWVETPFPLQGFLIRSQVDLDMLAKYCKFVMIDEQLGRPLQSYETRVPVQGRPAAGEATNRVVPKKQKFVRVQYEKPIPVEKEIRHVKAYEKQVRQSIGQIYNAIGSDKPVNLRVVRQASSVIVNSVVRNPDAMLWLGRLKAERGSAYERAMRMAVLSVIVARHIGLPKDAMESLAVGCLLSEVGKPVSAAILRKDEELSRTEKEELRRHVESTLARLADANIPQDILSTIQYHHERFDGGGVLSGLLAGEIPLTSRLAGLADVYDACIVGDANTPGMPATQVVSQLNKYRDVLFQADLIEAFIQAVGVYPTGCSVQLKNGSQAVVIGQNPERRLRPKVVVVRDANGRPVKSAQVIDLMQVNDPAMVIDSTLSESLINEVAM